MTPLRQTPAGLFVTHILLALILMTAAQSHGQQCAGDCDGDEVVGVNELIRSVNVALDRAPIESCAVVDTGFDGIVGIAELVAATRRALDGCPGSRFRLLGFEMLADNLPDRVGDTFVEADVCQNICPGDVPEPFSSTLMGVLIGASPGANAIVESIEVMYPERRLVVLRTETRHLIYPKYCVQSLGFPCETDRDCGASDSCVASPTSVAFTALDLARKELLGGEQCSTGLGPPESPLLVRIRLTDDNDDPIELIAGTTLIADDFDNCALR